MAVVEPVAGPATAEPVELEAGAESLWAADRSGLVSKALDEVFVVGVPVPVDPRRGDLGK